MKIQWLPFIQALSPSLLRFFLARFPIQEADELVQEAFLRLYEKVERGTFDDTRGTLEALAWGIALNLAKEARRRSRLKIVESRSDTVNFESDDVLEIRQAKMTTDDSGSDELLDSKIRSFRAIQSTDEQVLRWYLNIERKNQKQKSLWRSFACLAAGLCAGLSIGWSMSQTKISIEDFSATYQTVSIKYVLGGNNR